MNRGFHFRIPNFAAHNEIFPRCNFCLWQKLDGSIHVNLLLTLLGFCQSHLNSDLTCIVTKKKKKKANNKRTLIKTARHLFLSKKVQKAEGLKRFTDENKA